MTYLGNLILLITMAFSFVHCGGKKDKAKSEKAKQTITGQEQVEEKDSEELESPQVVFTGVFTLINRGDEEEEVRFSFSGSTENGLLVVPGQCVQF